MIRIAVLWTLIDGNLPYYFELTLATLLNAGADNVDIHVIVPLIPIEYCNMNGNNNNEYGNYMNILYQQDTTTTSSSTTTTPTTPSSSSSSSSSSICNIIYSNPINQVYFHSVTPNEWLQRINEKLNITLPYDIRTSMKKIADMKPMLGNPNPILSLYQ